MKPLSPNLLPLWVFWMQIIQSLVSSWMFCKPLPPITMYRQSFKKQWRKHLYSNYSRINWYMPIRYQAENQMVKNIVFEAIFSVPKDLQFLTTHVCFKLLFLWLASFSFYYILYWGFSNYFVPTIHSFYFWFTWILL